MKNDLNCPYCNAELEVCHDDGQGYEEDALHEMECGECKKSFVFNTYISFDYEAYKADCLNGGEHKLKMTTASPKEYCRMKCEDCEFERALTLEERKTIL